MQHVSAVPNAKRCIMLMKWCTVFDCVAVSQWGLGAITDLWCATVKAALKIDFCAEQSETFAFAAAFATEDLSFGTRSFTFPPLFVQWGGNRLCVLGRHYAGAA